MKRWKNITIIVGIVSLISILGLESLREGWQELRNHKTEVYLKSLSTWIELFREDNGQYPRTLSELLTNKNEDQQGKNAIQDLIKDIQHNPWRDNYDYKPSTNGFTIIVTGPEEAPAGWFGKQRKIEKHYDIGQALK